MKKLRHLSIALMVSFCLPADTLGDNDFVLFGHTTESSSVVQIDTSTGATETVGSTGFASTGAAGFARARSRVVGPDGEEFPAGTLFGLLTDAEIYKDFLVVIDTATGKATKIVQTQQPVTGRGLAFGPDGSTLYVLVDDQTLSTIDPTTGAFEKVGEAAPAKSLAWNPESETFLAVENPPGGVAGNNLFSISPSDGSIEEIVSLEEEINVNALARSSNQKWYTVNAGRQLLTIDPETGAFTIIGNTGHNVGGLVFSAKSPTNRALFSRVTEGSIVNDMLNSSSLAWGDFTGDDFPDLFVSNLGAPNSFYVNVSVHGLSMGRPPIGL